MRRLLIVALPLALVFGLALWRSQGPSPRGPETPADRFSSARAMEVLHELAGDGTPHPIGSERNRAVRARVEKRFQSLGYQTSMQPRFACNWNSVCGTVENILARVPGGSREATLLVVAHYDSVPAGPGASDDLVGVAALLEVARAISTGPAARHVTFLITDGEEAGLLGAEAFVDDEALADGVSAVINVENRGTWGPSNLFETSRGNLPLIRRLARQLERPQGTSLFYEIYNLLPNDTDLTVFKRAGKPGINFAAIRGVEWYHTPLDDVAHASPRTLQHHGENVLASILALAGQNLASGTAGDATYFDLLGFLLIWWPQRWTLWIAIASLVILFLAVRRQAAADEATFYSARGRLQPMTFGVLAAFAGILLSAALGIGLAWIARWGSRDLTWIASPQLSIAAMWLGGLGAALIGAALFRRRAAALPLLYGVTIVWHMIAIGLAMTIAGASYLFLVPAVVVTLCALLRAGSLATAVAATTTAAILFFPLGLQLYDALGGPLMHVVAIVIGTAAMLAAPELGSWRAAAAVSVLALACAIAAPLPAAVTAERPQHLSLTWIDDDAAPTPRWLAPRVSPPMAKVLRFSTADPALTPWSRARLQEAEAPSLEVPRVSLSAERKGDHVAIRVRSNRGAERVVLAFREGKILRINGATPAPVPERRRIRSFDGWQFAVVQTGGEMLAEIRASGPVEAIASDVTFGLPPAGAMLQAARDATPATPVHDGDVMITRSRGRF